METSSTASNDEQINKPLLANMNQLQSFLSPDEELAFMQLLYSSSAAIRGANFGLSRSEVEKMLKNGQDEEAFFSFIHRVNQGLSRYYKVIYDERRDQVVVLLHTSAHNAKSTLSSEALAILLLIFYQQEVLQHEFTLLAQLFDAFGHEQLKASQKLKVNMNTLIRIGAVEEYKADSQEEAYVLTAIGANMFSDSFLRRTIEFSQSQQFNKEDVMKFFKRYNTGRYEGEQL